MSEEADSSKRPALRVTFGHGGRHLPVKLSTEAVEEAIIADLTESRMLIGEGSDGRVTVQGIEIEYRAYRVDEGRIHVGTYFPYRG